MGKRIKKLTPVLIEFIQKQNLFFVGTAANEGTVNISPKGIDSIRVLNETKIVWLNLTGSGNETAAHLIKNNRMTIMFCAFDGKPLILRLYGTATIFHERDETYHKYINLFPKHLGTRQFIELDINLVQTSCGFGVPIMPFKEERTFLNSWAENHSEDEIKKYWGEKNMKSIDGFETKILKD